MDNKKSLMLMSSALFISVVVFTLVVGLGAPQVAPSNSATIDYHSNVCVYKNGELIQCDHNVLFDNGKDMVKEALGTSGTIGVINNISLCNATIGDTGGNCGTPQADASEAHTEYDGCGLNNVVGNYDILSPEGNWSIYQTFTSTCDNRVTNVTRLTNNTGGIFAGNEFAEVTLQTDDQLTINWTIFVT